MSVPTIQPLSDFNAEALQGETVHFIHDKSSGKDLYAVSTTMENGKRSNAYVHSFAVASAALELDESSSKIYTTRVVDGSFSVKPADDPSVGRIKGPAL